MKRSFVPILFLLVATLLASFATVQAQVRPVDRLDIPESYEGQVTVDVLWGYGIGVALDIAPADGVADRVYVLQKSALAPEELPLTYDHARVLYHQHAVVVTGSPNQKGVILLLEREEHLTRQMELVDGELRRAIDKRGATAQLPPPRVYTGFGLIERPGQWANPFSELIRERGGLVADKDACSPGATQCSVGCGDTCSITCGSGYYACCKCRGNIESCDCVADGGGNGGGGLGGGGFGGGGTNECHTNGFCPASCMSCSPYYGGEDETPGAVGSGS